MGGYIAKLIVYLPTIPKFAGSNPSITFQHKFKINISVSLSFIRL
jgi:hypothetical protein